MASVQRSSTNGSSGLSSSQRPRAGRVHGDFVMDASASHLAAAARLAESRADAVLHYPLGNAFAHAGQRIIELDGQPANGLSAD